ncbi:MAG: hypothetical protein WBD40_13715 [Tepidisphaeraceae bacterium]
MSKFLDRSRAFWFAPAPPTSLGFCRLVFFAGLLWVQWPLLLHRWGGVPEMYRKPIWTFRVLRLPFLSQDVLIGMEIAWALAIVLAAIGLFTRAATAVAFGLGFYLLLLGNNFGKIGHGDQAIVLTMLILALARCGDAWSIDARRADRRRGDGRERSRPTSGEYRWPIRMVWLLMCLIFCAAGVTKLLRSGVAWITSDHLRNTLILAHHYYPRPPTDLGLYLARFPRLCHVMAAGVIALELSFPLALVLKRARGPIVAATLLMQVGIGLLMGVWFLEFFLLYAFWVPWDRLGVRLGAALTRLRDSAGRGARGPREVAASDRVS